MMQNVLHLHKIEKSSLKTLLYLSVPILVFFAVLALMLGRPR